MDRDRGGETQRDEKEDLEVSSNKPKGIYERKRTAFIRRDRPMEGTRKERYEFNIIKLNEGREKEG